MQPHDIEGMIQIMDGNARFEQKLDDLFAKDQFDMANEPDFAYPFLYNFIPGKAEKASKKVDFLIDNYYKNAPYGIPGNDDTGKMSAWAMYAMMVIYPMISADPSYTLVKPRFNKVVFYLNTKFYEHEILEIRSDLSMGQFNVKALLDGKKFQEKILFSKELFSAEKLYFNSVD